MTEQQQQLALKYCGLARRQAWRASRATGLPYDDLASEALLHLCKLAIWFDAGKGKPFAPIAARCIHQRLRQWVGKQTRHSSTGSLDPEIHEPASHRSACRLEVADSVRRIKDLVEPHEWDLLYQKHVAGKTYRALGVESGRCRGTMEERVLQIKRKLVQAMQEEW